MNNQRKLGAILSYVAQFVHIIVNLVYTPIMIRLVGQSEYGLYQLVFSVVSYLNLLSFGFNAAYIRFYSRYKAVSDDDGIGSLNGMFMTIFTVIAAIAAIAGLALILNIETVLGDNLTAAEMETATVLMILMVINLVITFPTSVFDCYITSQEQFVFQKVIIILQYAANPIFTLPLLMLGYGSVAMIGVTTIFSFAKLAVCFQYCIRKLKMRFSFRNFDVSLLLEMGTFTFFIFLNQIINEVNWSVGKFLLGRYIGTVAVALFGLASTVNSMYLQLSTSVSNVFVPKINALIVKNEGNEEISALFTKVGRVQFFILALVLIGFISVGKPFMCMWGGAEFAQSYYITLLLIVPVTIPLIQNLGIEIQRARNMHQARSIVYFFIALGNILISIPLIHRFGAVGAAMGTAISLFAGNGLFMNWYYHKKIGLDIMGFWKQIASILPSMILPSTVGVLVFRYADISGWRQLFIYGMIIALVYAVSVYFFGMNAYEKNLVHSILNKVFRKR